MTGFRQRPARRSRALTCLVAAGLTLVALVGVGAAFGVTHALAGEGDATGQPGGLTPTTPPGVTTSDEIRFDPRLKGFKLLKPGSKLPSGAECARRVRRHPWEPVLSNYEANHTVGHKIKNARLGLTKAGRKMLQRVDGNFTGTTDEILRWASCKWGVDTDPVRAQAFVESTWNQGAVGDAGQSFGITQIKEKFHYWAFPGARESTAMNVDYTLALWRLCYEGYVKRLPDDAYWNKEGCFGWHFTDEWGSPEARAYVDRIGAALAGRPWWLWPGQVPVDPGSTGAPPASRKTG